MVLKIGTLVKEVKRIFWVRIFSGGFRIGLQRNLVVPGF
jgi:hypothetical protein